MVHRAWSEAPMRCCASHTRSMRPIVCVSRMCNSNAHRKRRIRAVLKYIWCSCCVVISKLINSRSLCVARPLLITGVFGVDTYKCDGRRAKHVASRYSKYASVERGECILMRIIWCLFRTSVILLWLYLLKTASAVNRRRIKLLLPIASFITASSQQTWNYCVFANLCLFSRMFQTTLI